MGIFGGYYTYKEPERLTRSEARLRRLENEIKRVQSLEDRPPRLSPVNKVHLNRLKEFQREFSGELEARRRRVADFERQRDPSILRSPAYKSAMSRLFKLQQRQNALVQRANAERRANQFQKSFVDRRQFSFGDKFIGKTVFGYDALLKVHPDEVTRRVFKHALLSLPCIQRMVRREVMFARGHGGRGHRGRHRFNPLSMIGC